jgi:hypothetical protein
MLAYVGLGPGQELIPYFYVLLTFMGMALLAVLQWPIVALRRWLTRIQGDRKDKVKFGPILAHVPESYDEGRSDRTSQGIDSARPGADGWTIR